jgi:hypothetical protein
MSNEYALIPFHRNFHFRTYQDWYSARVASHGRLYDVMRKNGYNASALEGLTLYNAHTEYRRMKCQKIPNPFPPLKNLPLFT